MIGGFNSTQLGQHGGRVLGIAVFLELLYSQIANDWVPFELLPDTFFFNLAWSVLKANFSQAELILTWLCLNQVSTHLKFFLFFFLNETTTFMQCCNDFVRTLSGFAPLGLCICKTLCTATADGSSTMILHSNVNSPTAIHTIVFCYVFTIQVLM